MINRINAIHTWLSRRLALGSWRLQASLPNRCLLCHLSLDIDGDSEQTGICSVCLATCLYDGDICLGCGRALQVASSFCGTCQHSHPLKVIAPASYHNGIGPLVAGIKYQQQIAPLKVLVAALVRRIEVLVAQERLILPQVLLPVPLHAERLRQRGFNQAWLIANELSHRLNIPMDDKHLVRASATRPQAGMTGKQRRKNCHQAFELIGTHRYQRVAIVDDVVTTGTTANEIAKLLLTLGTYAEVWCLARAEAPGLAI